MLRRPRHADHDQAHADDGFATPRAASKLCGVGLPRISKASLSGELRVVRRGSELLISLSETDALAAKAGGQA
jgi:hypothetical protein